MKPKSTQKNPIGSVVKWMNSIKDSAHYKIKEITLDQASEWLLENGIIHHYSHRFFNVVGVKTKYPDGRIDYRPKLEQREIGTLYTGPQI